MPEGADLLRESRPSAALAARLTRLAGRDNRYATCGGDDVMVAAGRWAAVEAHAAAMKLAAVAEVIRRSPDESSGGGMASAGDMPVRWQFGTEEQIGLELLCSPGSAGRLLGDSWQLAVRLPLTWRALHAGILDLSKARMIVAETSILSDAAAQEAERQLSEYWAGKTWAQLFSRISRIVINLDPDAAEKKRERAQRDDAKVRFWRETTGAAVLAGYGLPPDEALQADARIQARARAYRKAGISGTMDQLRAAAYLDLINGSDARDRLGLRTDADVDADTDGYGGDGTISDRGPGDSRGEADGTTGRPYAASPGDDLCANGTDEAGPVSGLGDDDAGDDPDGAGGVLPGNGGPGNGGPGGSGPGGSGGGASGSRGGQHEYGEGIVANLDLTLPLATLTGLAERAGEAARLGAIDPALVRSLARAAIRNAGSTIRVVITGRDGRAVGFGIARRRYKRDTGRGNPPPFAPTRPAGSAGQPATTEHLPRAGLADGRSGHSGPSCRVSGGMYVEDAMSDGSHDFAFQPVVRPAMLPLAGADSEGAGLDGVWGMWRLTADGREWDVELIPVPAPGPCAHEHGTASYQPGRVLRSLVQIRDGQCAMPVCGRLAAGTQWEHAIPWPIGQTCSCNGGLHCVRHHRVKDQADEWTIVQLADGRRRWITPIGLRYTSELRQYPD